MPAVSSHKNESYEALSQKQRDKYLGILRTLFGDDFTPPVENFFKAWMKSLGQGFDIEKFTHETKPIALVVAKNLTPQKDWEAIEDGEPVNFTTRQGNTVTVEHNKVELTGENSQNAAAEELVAMAFSAVNRNPDKLNNKIILDGSRYQQAILQLSLEYINNTRGGAALNIKNKLSNEDLVNSGAYKAFSAHIKTMGLEPPPAPAAPTSQATQTPDHFQADINSGFTIPDISQGVPTPENISRQRPTSQPAPKKKRWPKIAASFAAATMLGGTLAVNHFAPDIFNGGDAKSDLRVTSSLTTPQPLNFRDALSDLVKDIAPTGTLQAKATEPATTKQKAGKTQKLYSSPIDPQIYKNAKAGKSFGKDGDGVIDLKYGETVLVEEGANVRSKGDGEVIDVVTINQNNKSVVTKHTLNEKGDFITIAYRGLGSNLKVKVGDIVDKGATLGPVSSGKKLYYEVWKDGIQLKPSEQDFDIFTNAALEAVAKAEQTLLTNPVPGSYLSSKFGFRKHPTKKRADGSPLWRKHQGIDLAAKKGTPVLAAGDGKISFREEKGGYGKMVCVEHTKTLKTCYGHNSRFAKEFGLHSKVKQGDTIAYVGSTGVSTGNHSHYEVIKDGKYQNPKNKITFALATTPDKNPKFAKTKETTSKPTPTKVASSKDTPPTYSAELTEFDEIFDFVIHEFEDFKEPSKKGTVYIDFNEKPTKRGLNGAWHEKEVNDPNFTMEDTRKLAKKEYWDDVGCGDLPPHLRLPCFDGAFNQGPPTMKIFLSKMKTQNSEELFALREALYRQNAKKHAAKNKHKKKVKKYPLKSLLNRLELVKEHTPKAQPRKPQRLALNKN